MACRVWAVDLTADGEEEDYSDNSTVTMVVLIITLTDEGLANLQQVNIFSAISLCCVIFEWMLEIMNVDALSVLLHLNNCKWITDG